MSKSGSIKRYWVIGIIMVIQACSLQPQSPPEPVVAKPIVVEPAVEPAPEAPVLPAPAPRPERVVVESYAIVVSANNNSHQHIAEAVKQRLTRPVEMVYLSATPQQQQRALDSLQASHHKQVVAIGSVAARFAKGLEQKRVVFAQVFNYQDEGLLEAGFSGVSMVPSADKVFSSWKNVSPGLARLVVFTGPNNAAQVDVIKLAASHHQLFIQHQVVNSDKELLYAIKQLSADVQGLWLLPDHRILSRRSIKELMSHNMKKGRQVVVFNRQMLKYGGLIYAGVDVNDIGEQIVAQLQAPSIPVAQLTEATIEFNQEQLRLVGTR